MLYDDDGDGGCTDNGDDDYNLVQLYKVFSSKMLIVLD